LPEPVPSSRSARFGAFELDPRAGELRSGAQIIRLQEKPLRMLLLLLENSGKVVTPEQIRIALWPGDITVEFDHGIGTALKKLRRALGDDAANPRYIETLARRGYRWLASVEWVENGKSAGEALGDRPPSSPEPTIDSIAVLPFANLSADTENEYFSDGLAEEILNGLARVRGLRVVARTSAFAFRGKEQDVRAIGRALRVGAILEGSVRRAGSRIRVAVQLISANDGYHLWSESYDREMSDVFAIQEEIAQAVVRVSKVKLASQPEGPLVRRGTVNLEAYHSYLQGRLYYEQMTPASLARCRACHERAIALDPNYAFAYAGLAEHYYMLAFYLNAPPREAMPLALAAAQRAIELDPCCADAYSVRGAVRAAYQYQWKSADKDFTRSLELNPGSATARHRRAGWYLQPVGRLEEALAEIQRGLELDPLWAIPRTAEPFYMCLLGRNAEAIERVREVIELFPWFWFGYFIAGVVFGCGGLASEGAAAIEKGLNLDPGNPFLLAIRAFVHHVAGEPAEARRIWRQLEETAQTRYTSPGPLYIASAASGEFDRSYEWLDKGVEERDPMTMNLVTKLSIPGYENDPRYLALMRKMNLSHLLLHPHL
jgi:TolB-like protein